MNRGWRRFAAIGIIAMGTAACGLTDGNGQEVVGIDTMSVACRDAKSGVVINGQGYTLNIRGNTKGSVGFAWGKECGIASINWFGITKTFTK